MPYVLADQNSWLEKGKDPFDFKVLTTFENMINSVRYAFSIRNAKRLETAVRQLLCGNISRQRNIMTLVVFVILAIYTLRIILQNYD
jgi:hypothetical protein